MSVAYLVLKLLQNIVQKLGGTTPSPFLPPPPLQAAQSVNKFHTKLINMKVNQLNIPVKYSSTYRRAKIEKSQKIKKSVLILEKRTNCVDPWIESSIHSVVLRISKGKSSNVFLLCFKQKVYLCAVILQNLHCPEKYLVACQTYSEMFHMMRWTLFLTTYL